LAQRITWEGKEFHSLAEHTVVCSVRVPV